MTRRTDMHRFAALFLLAAAVTPTLAAFEVTLDLYVLDFEATLEPM